MLHYCIGMSSCTITHSRYLIKMDAAEWDKNRPAFVIHHMGLLICLLCWLLRLGVMYWLKNPLVLFLNYFPTSFQPISYSPPALPTSPFSRSTSRFARERFWIEWCQKLRAQFFRTGRTPWCCKTCTLGTFTSFLLIRWFRVAIDLSRHNSKML